MTQAIPKIAVEQATLNSVLAAINSVAGDVRSIHEDLSDLKLSHENLKRRVDGSNPPASGGGGEPVAVQAARGSAAGFDVEELRGELLAVRTELGKQSRAMGLTTAGLSWLFSKDGVATGLRIATALAAGYAALHQAGMIK